MQFIGCERLRLPGCTGVPQLAAVASPNISNECEDSEMSKFAAGLDCSIPSVKAMWVAEYTQVLWTEVPLLVPIVNK